MDRLNELHEAGYKVTLDNKESQWTCGYRKSHNKWNFFRSPDVDNAVSLAVNHALKPIDLCNSCGREV